jgi:hypothetical protein
MPMPIIGPIITSFFFPNWVVLMVLGLNLTLFWSQPLDDEVANAPRLRRSCGILFEWAGYLLFCGCVIYGVIKQIL